MTTGQQNKNRREFLLQSRRDQGYGHKDQLITIMTYLRAERVAVITRTQLLSLLSSADYADGRKGCRATGGEAMKKDEDLLPTSPLSAEVNLGERQK